MIIGIRDTLPDGTERVMLTASSSVRQFEMKTSLGMISSAFGSAWSFSCMLGDFTVAYGNDYAEALSRLFGTWQPPEASPDVKGITQGPGELPA
jgi:hypothetical protein